MAFAINFSPTATDVRRIANANINTADANALAARSAILAAALSRNLQRAEAIRQAGSYDQAIARGHIRKWSTDVEPTLYDSEFHGISDEEDEDEEMEEE